MSQFDRTIQMLGEEAQQILSESHVAVFGLGGVGGSCAEALARAGIGHMDIFDGDTVDLTNLNRQVIALHSTIGQPKAEVCKARLKDINPLLRVSAYQVFYDANNADLFPFDAYDIVIDCIDTVSSKLLIIERARRLGIPVLSCMGTGNKLDIRRFKISPIEKTSVCPLCRVMRTECKKRGFAGVRVLWSDEEPINPLKKRTPGSVSFVPPAAGMMLAGEAIRLLLAGKKDSDGKPDQ